MNRVVSVITILWIHHHNTLSQIYHAPLRSYHVNIANNATMSTIKNTKNRNRRNSI